MLRRSQVRRKPLSESRREPRPLRRGVLLAMGPEWNTLAQVIRRRDDDHCRRCGWVALASGGSIDHIIPRRLCRNARQANRPENLCLLDIFCHSVKTHTVEKALFDGDPHPFYEFLKVIGQSGPVPAADQVGEAFQRLRELLAR